ncbi:hypothetical protein U8Y98_01615 [Priestia megaterium]|uniref:hypothetical protein n=1 Tax=Priestia megaterium TaxID=1404 RepID=UPI002FDF4473
MAYDALLNVQSIEVTGTGAFENENYIGNGARVFGSIEVSNASAGATTSIVVEESNDGSNWSPVKAIDVNEPFIQEPYYSNEIPSSNLSFVDNANKRFKFKANSKKFRFSYDVVGTVTIGINIGNT